MPDAGELESHQSWRGQELEAYQIDKAQDSSMAGEAKAKSEISSHAYGWPQTEEEEK